ncbi:MAG: hypothetical protein INF18_04980 [Methylobacterium sp.]|nr:hypothetical protein [Methylobacterium sp.]MCA3637808.1 hypothetical protein [Methylobacterium sp.]
MTEKTQKFRHPEAVAKIFDRAASQFRPPLVPEHEKASAPAASPAAALPPEQREAENEEGQKNGR